jgi:hypothetical protein
MGGPQRVLTLAFLRPGPNDSRVNRLVAGVCAHGVCHAELIFEDSMALSIFAGQNVFFKPRTFSNPSYELVSLAVSQMEYGSAYAFCRQAAQHELGFTDVGMVASYLQPRHCPCVHTASSLCLGYTFCSKIVAEALQIAGVPEFEHLTPCTTTPSCLYQAASLSQRRILNSVPYKRDQLALVGVMRAPPRA